MTMTTLMFIASVGLLVHLQVRYGTLVRNKWGINSDSVSCPRCNTAIPRYLKHESHGRFGNPCGAVGRVRIVELRWTNGGVSFHRSTGSYFTDYLTNQVLTLNSAMVM